MQASTFGRRGVGSLEGLHGAGARNAQDRHDRRGLAATLSDTVNGWVDLIAPCPWSAHIGLSNVGTHTAWSDHVVGRGGPSHHAFTAPAKRPLYSQAERQRRDATPWTLVQGVLAPLQFLAFAVSLTLIARYLLTGRGYELATASILIKTGLLYAIMITGSIWEKAVFGKWLFARAFFWEDVVSMVVMGLQTAYLASLIFGLGAPDQQMAIAVAAYAAYAINASQFLLKLRAARLEAGTAGLPGVAA